MSNYQHSKVCPTCKCNPNYDPSFKSSDTHEKIEAGIAPRLKAARRRMFEELVKDRAIPLSANHLARVGSQTGLVVQSTALQILRDAAKHGLLLKTLPLDPSFDLRLTYYKIPDHLVIAFEDETISRSNPV